MTFSVQPVSSKARNTPVDFSSHLAARPTYSQLLQQIVRSGEVLKIINSLYGEAEIEHKAKAINTTLQLKNCNGKLLLRIGTIYEADYADESVYFVERDKQGNFSKLSLDQLIGMSERCPSPGKLPNAGGSATVRQKFHLRDDGFYSK